MGKRNIYIIIGAVLLAALSIGSISASKPLVLGAPATNFQKDVVPQTDSLYTLGTTTKTWLNLFVDQICLNGDCQTSWAGGSADGTFSTTSANYWATFGLAFSTTSANYWESQQAARGADGTFSTTSANYWSTFGLGFSTTSTNYWKTQTTFESLTAGDGLTRTADDFDCDTATASVLGCIGTADWASFNSRLSTSTLALFDKGYFFSTTSANYWGSVGLAFSTTSTNYWKTQNTFEALTAGDGLTRTTDDFDCDTASGSVFGCITAANWTTFNMKVATGSAETRGQLAYWATTAGSPATLNSVATTSLTLSSAFSHSGTPGAFVGGSAGTLSSVQTPAFTFATTTAWGGTTTIPLGPAFYAETWNSVKCFTNTGTLWVAFDDGTNVMNYFQASTTVGTITLSTNNSYTAGEKRYVKIGNPASSPTTISCTVNKTI